MKKIIDLNERKLEIELEGHLEQIGLDREMIEEYDSSIKEAAREKILEFFNKREEVSKIFDSWIGENFSNDKDMLVFLSVMSEHLQNLLVPDLDEMNDLFASLGSQEDAIKGLKTIDEMIIIAGAFEGLHMKSMKGYLVK